MRDYRFTKRIPAELDVEYSKVPEEQVEFIAQELFSVAETDGSFLLRELKELPDHDISDLLLEEQKAHKDSPLIDELRRRAKVRCKKDARRIANAILRG